MEFERSYEPDLLKLIPVIVSVCPNKPNSILLFFKLRALMELSRPPKNM